MVYVAWWTGKGYQAILTVIASAIIAELARGVLGLPQGAWIFGIALIGAAIVNWRLGRKANRKSLRKVRSVRLRDRLFYRARHKFMSLPMETFSVLLVVGGVVALGSTFIN